MKEVVIIRNMSELGAGTRGASLGYKALEMASLKFGKDLFSKTPTLKVKTFNEELHVQVSHPFAKHIGGILKSAEEAGKVISESINNSQFPVVISGDHSNAASTIYAIRRSHPDKKLGIIWIDAHGDLHSPFTTPSGNMHGMPLAISLAEDNIEKKRNDVDSETEKKWNQLKGLGEISPKISPENIIFFGVRDTEGAEDYLIKELEIRNFKVEEIRHRSVDTCVSEAKEKIADCDLIYVSFDVDAMDCNLVSKGTGTPVANGLTPEESQQIIEHFINDERLVCLEMVEINPLLDDKGNKMAETTVRILDNVIRKYLKS